MNVSPGWAGCWLGPVFAHLFSASRVSVEYTWTLAACYTYPTHPPPHHRCTTSTNIFIKFSVFIFGFSAAKNGFSENYTQLKIINRLSSLLLCTQLLQETFLSTKYYDCFIVIIHFAECKLRSGSKLAPTF